MPLGIFVQPACIKTTVNDLQSGFDVSGHGHSHGEFKSRATGDGSVPSRRYKTTRCGASLFRFEVLASAYTPAIAACSVYGPNLPEFNERREVRSFQYLVSVPERSILVFK
ncbi:MAG: hypothetical protein U0892_15025 [Pirellulales bacterium]